MQEDVPAHFDNANTRHSTISDARVAIVGLGLMGGSLAAALSSMHVCREVVGIARRPSSLATARSLRFIHRGTTDLAEGLRDADVVVLATPVRDILDKLGQVGPMMKQNAIVIDVGSTKTAICEAMMAMPPHVQPIGGHPMCGKESSGLTMAEPGLYRDRVFVLTPLARTSARTLALMQEMVRGIGARALILEPQYHDQLVAAISHLPYMVAVTLVAAAEQVAQGDDMQWKLAAGGFRDTSRVAAGSIPMMMDILTTNRQPILKTLYAAQAQLASLTHLLEEKDDDRLREALECARQRRVEMYT